jgi:anthranilate synthase/aminodeoxychorismate synthase-like glutamine amidotransferase
MIDNYDSFTYNLVQFLLTLGARVTVKRNDEITPAQALAGNFTHLVISPGPGAPSEAGVSKEMIEKLAGKVPILGVCLGHQAMAEVFGGRVGRAKCLMHGKSSMITHDGLGLYAGLDSPLEVGRYHSLVAFESDLPKELIVTSRTIAEPDRPSEIMGVRHRTLDVEGVQFHPESVLTPHGPKLLANFLGVPIERATSVIVRESSKV